jgi:tyrosine-protein kinase Etk/Wzc
MFNTRKENDAQQAQGAAEGASAARVAQMPAPGRRPSEDAPAMALVWTLIEYRWTALAVAATVVGLAAAYVVLAPRVYETSAVVQVDGEAGARAGFDDLAPLFDAKTPTEGEMLMMHSRQLLEAVVAQLGLDVEASPRWMPVVGEALARRHRDDALAPPRFGLTRFAWGGERIRLRDVSVSERLVGAPLTLTALDGGRYRVAAADGAVLAEGKVGEPATGTDGERSVALRVTDLVARPGTEFTIRKLSPVDAIERLDQNLQVRDEGRHTGLVKLTLTGHDPVRTTATLQAITDVYLRQNVDRTSAEAAKTLKVLEAQLPVLKSNLEKAEVVLNDFRLRNGTVDLSREGESMLDRAGEIDRQIAELQLRMAEMHRYSTDHPDLPGLERRAEALRAQRNEMDARMRSLPERELASTRLSRQVRVATEMYTTVLHRAEELRIVKSGWIGNVRVLESPSVPYRPARPQPAPILVLSIVLGAIGGVVAATARKQLDPGAKHPDEIEAATGLAVFATIPRSGMQRALARRGKRGPLVPLAVAEPTDPAIEDLRALRSSVQFALLRARSNVVAIGGLAPLAGKSFVSVNLAHLLAAADGRVLLVDGDLRRGVLHRYFGVEPEPGLAEVVAGATPLEAAVRRTDNPNLDLLSAGRLAGSPAELLAGAPLEQLLADLGRRYKVVVVDTPPVLSVNDSALFARHAGVNLLVLRAGEHSAREIGYAVRRLGQNGVAVRGFILNDVRPSRLPYRRSQRYRWYGVGIA